MGYMKWTTPIILLTVITGLRAEVHQLTLKQAVDTALKQNPEIILARLDEQKAALGVTVAKDPFIPRVVVGSGLAQSWGFPLSIEGSAPSIIRAQAIMSVYNRSYSYLVAQAKENARTATIDQNAKRDDIAFRTASAYLDILRARQALDMLRRQAESLQRVQAAVAVRITEGRELPVDGKRAEFNLSRSRQRADALELDIAHAETSLALVLGYGPNDRVKPVAVEGAIGDLPESEESSVETALENSKEVRKFESQLQAKGFEKRSYDAQRLPSLDLVAQYALFGRYNNYEDFFRTFQRHNGQLGVSIQLPILPGGAAKAKSKQADAEMEQLRLQLNSARNRITVDTRHSFQEVRRARGTREVARLDLELAREQLSVSLEQMNGV